MAERYSQRNKDERPQLKSPADLGMKPEKPAPKATPTPKPLYQRLKRAAGEMTVSPAHQAEQYITDALKDAGK